jgi:hypothetical protein
MASLLVLMSRPHFFFGRPGRPPPPRPGSFAHGFHHVGHLAVHLEKLVDRRRIGAGTGGDALLAAECLRMSGLARSALVIEPMMAIWRAIVLSSMPADRHLLLHLAHAGHHAHHAAHAAELLHLPELLGEVVEVELALLHPLGHHGLRLFGVDSLGAFSTSETMSPMPRMRSAMRSGMEFLQRVHLFAGADQLDRLAGDGAHGQRRAAAAIAVHAGQHEAGDADALVEIARQVDRVLTGQRIGHQQVSCGLGAVADSAISAISGFVDNSAAGGVEHDHVMAAELGRLHGARGDLDRADWPAMIGSVSTPICSPRWRAAPARPGGACRARPSDLLACRAFQPLGDLGRGGGLARALQADHHDDDGGAALRSSGRTPSCPASRPARH